jgi:NAD(P)-dependent dehydrogenase (short-subunit alcohol dehydrogenase family)
MLFASSLLLLLLLIASVSNSAVAIIIMSSSSLSPSSSLLPLAGKRVLITGAGRGIGRAMAHICHRQGAAHIAICSRNEVELQETVRSAVAVSDDDEKSRATTTNAAASRKDDDDITCHSNNNNNNNNEQQRNKKKQKWSIHATDVTNQAQVEDMVRSIVQQWGGLDILINNAGGAQNPKGPVDALHADQLQQLLQINVVAVHIVTSTVLRLAMKQTGKIINVSSKAGKVGLPNYSFYVASKFALEGLTSSWAKELANDGRSIQVNSISPGMIHTQSFPKPVNKRGVRSAESVEGGLMVLLASTTKTGHYLHVDELDQARAAGLPDDVSMKPIDEAPFDPTRKENA